MSWLWKPQGDAPKPEPGQKLVEDPAIPNRKVVNKTANQPFLAYKEYRDKRDFEHQAWLQRKKEREEKVARGEKVGPEEPDPTEEREVGVVGLLKFLLYLTIVVLLAGKFFTGHFLWEYDGKWAQLKTYMPSDQRLFSEGYLATFDGSDLSKPLYLAIDSDVYDVSSNRRTYGPGGSYHLMAGIDAARSFGTGCFAVHRTHDLRGLTESEMKSVQHWKDFFANHKTYRKVGRVSHPPVDPLSSIPEHCDPKKEEAAQKQRRAVQDAERPPNNHPTGATDHTEL